MASIDVGIHPDPSGITTRRFSHGTEPFSTLAPFSILEFNVRDCHVRVYVHNRAVLGALQAALDEIRADMDASEQGQYEAELDKPAHVPGEYVTGASDQVPTVECDWPAPGELMEIHGK
jgi:hypothetical protein